MTDGEGVRTKEEAVTEITRIIEVETVEITETGSAPSVTTTTSLSELNVIAVASQKVEAEGTEEVVMAVEVVMLSLIHI